MLPQSPVDNECIQLFIQLIFAALQHIHPALGFSPRQCTTTFSGETSFQSKNEITKLAFRFLQHIDTVGSFFLNTHNVEVKACLHGKVPGIL